MPISPQDILILTDAEREFISNAIVALDQTLKTKYRPGTEVTYVFDALGDIPDRNRIDILAIEIIRIYSEAGWIVTYDEKDNGRNGVDRSLTFKAKPTSGQGRLANFVDEGPDI
ncbi:MAG: hypothetical protein UZ21_OP11001000706 [Microgenomates bacterium OLB22]|nr:MAG: hypothetical protein UZ21_OP11001000706 [Microgenomates bacterium OLB22]